MCEWGTSTLILIRDWRRRGGPRRLVAVDACIAGLVKALNDAGIRTLGCCCGHYGRFPGPSILIAIPSRSEVVEIQPEPAGSWSVRAHNLTRYRTDGRPIEPL